MKAGWRRNLMPIALVVLFSVETLATGFLPRSDDRQEVDRTWEGGGNRLLFVDTMSAGLASYYEAMDPIPGTGKFQYYGGAVPQVDGAETLGSWPAERWRHEWWRWGEEGFQETEFGTVSLKAWHQSDTTSTQEYLHFGDLGTYPNRAFAGAVSPVVDLRAVEAPANVGVIDASYRDPEEFTAQRAQLNSALAATPVVQASNDDVAINPPRILNASAALRLRHAYDFETDAGGSLRDGGRVEVSMLDPVRGWLGWTGLAPTANMLRVGDDGLHGRYAAAQGAEIGWDVAPADDWSNKPEGTPVDADGYADDGVGLLGLGPTSRPWMYQGEIQGSSNDPRGQTWQGFGGSSGAFIDSVFDLTDYAGRLVRFRFVVATGGDEAKGQGWLLDQMEVHAGGRPGVELIAPVTPTEGALLAPGADPPLVVAVQNTHPAEAQAKLRVEVEGAGAAGGTTIIPAGPWGRVFHTFKKSLQDLAPGATGLQHLTVEVTEIPVLADHSVLEPALEGNVQSPPETDSARFHFQFGGPTQWRVVQVVTEAVRLGAEDSRTRPDDRVILRNQLMRIHVDLENLGPHEVKVGFEEAETAAVNPRLVDATGAALGTFERPGAVNLPASREASGSLGQAHSVRRATWEWSGIPHATILTLLVDYISEDGSRGTVDAGTVRVETMQPNVLDIDLQNHWQYSTQTGTGCRRTAGDQRYTGVLACQGAIASPSEPVHALDLRRGANAHLFLTYKGTGNLTLQVNGDRPDGVRPTDGSAWTPQGVTNLPPQSDWDTLQLDLGNIPTGWIRALLETEGSLEVDELRVEVGPPGKRLPLLWHTFSAELAIETTGQMQSVTGGDLALLDAAAARVNDALGPQSGEVLVGSVDSGEDEVVVATDVVVASVAVDNKVPGMATLELPGVYQLGAARPALRFLHWMAPSPAAIGYVEAARIQGPQQIPRWEPVVAFVAPLEREAAMEDVTVPLWDFAGDSVMLRFRYQVDAPLQPNNAPKGWALDAIVVEQIRPVSHEILHRATGDYLEDGYVALGTRFVDGVTGAARALPLLVDQVEVGAPYRVPQRYDDLRAVRFGILGYDDPDEAQRNSVCASINRPSTYHMGQSVITDALDLRALQEPVLVLEHGGRWHGMRTFGRSVFDLEYQQLGDDGIWGPWKRAAPYGPEVVDGSFKGRQPYLQDASLDGEGGFVDDPFARQTWGQLMALSSNLHFNQAEQRVDLRGQDASMFSLKSPGPAGEIARFRFLYWDENTPGGCMGGEGDEFDWYLYSMKVFEATHLFDAGLDRINVSRDDRALLDREDPQNGLPPGTAVVAEDALWADVHVKNQGKLAHLANVTLQLLDADGLPVPNVVRFLDRSGTGPGISTGRDHGNLQLQPKQDNEARFRVEFNRVPPGDYTLQSIVDLDDALDTNPSNDVWSRQVRVIAVRALGLDTSSVEPQAGTPEERRILSLEVHNNGNVRDGVGVEARVVRLTGVGRDEDIGPPLADGTRTPYLLHDRLAADLPARTGSARLTWDLVGDQDGALRLQDLLEPGQRYAVNVTLTPAPTVKAWWQSQGNVPPEHVMDFSASDARCGCYHVPFLVEDLLAASDFTERGTFSQLDGYIDAVASWNATTTVRTNGEWQGIEPGQRPDLPRWRLVNSTAAGQVAGEPSPGNAWHLPAYDGYEAIEHTLTSPPLPGHIIDSTSQAILDLRYASGAPGENRDDVRLEVRTLLPGGMWGDWEPVDSLRSKRIAIVLPPDFPNVISDRTNDHPIPPFYTADAGDPAQQGSHTWNRDGPNIGIVDEANTLAQGCNKDVERVPPRCVWSPFPMFPRPLESGHNVSVETLAIVLSGLVDEVGANNVGLFTTLPDDGLGEFTIPQQSLTTRGIELVADGVPRVRVASANALAPPFEVPILDLDDLAQGLNTYGAILVLGDGLTRYAAGNGLAPALSAMSDPFPNATFKHPRVTVPAAAEWTTPELDRHFADLLQILRFAPDAGINVVGALGPASASLGLSGIAEGVPLALWLPGTLAGTREGIPVPLSHRCLLEFSGAGTQLDPLRYRMEVLVQPKHVCGIQSGSTFNRYANYVYAAADDVQARVLRDLMLQGGATLAARFYPAGDPNCGTPPPGTLFMPPCVRGAEEPVSFMANKTRFVTAAHQGQAAAWVGMVLAALHADGTLPAGDGAWEALPMEMATPVGGQFRPGPDGTPRFVGETMQFRIAVRSEPGDAGHGMFLLGGFRLLGTPPLATDVEARVADPVAGIVREPTEQFHVTAEVINRGLNATSPTNLTIQFAQIPGAGDCGGDCIVHEFHPVARRGNIPSQVLSVPGLAPGARYVVTVGGVAGSGDSHAPADILYATQGTAFNGGRFPAVPPSSPPNPSLWFNVTARLGQDSNGFAAMNDIHSVTVVGQNIVNSLVKEPARDILVLPNQALHPDGEVALSAAPSTSGLEARVRLTNDGSNRFQVADIRVDVHAALGHECKPDRYELCDADRTPLASPIWSTSLNGLEVPRGKSQSYNLHINLDEAGIPPGVYRIHFTIETTAPVAAQQFDRWVYLAGSAAGPWAVYREDLAEVTGANFAAASRAWNAGPTTFDANGPPTFWDSTTACRADPTTTNGDMAPPAGNGVPQQHGWRISDATDDVCNGARDPGTHALHWIRPVQGTFTGNPTWPQPPALSQTPGTTDGRGLSDFGPDAVIWHPGHDSRLVNDFDSRPPESLANFEPGTAALVLDSRFQATPETAYVVQMQVAARRCVNAGAAGVMCNWVWDWMGPNGTMLPWFPLQASDGVTSASPLPVMKQSDAATCVPPTGGNGGPQCTREVHTNPLAGIPGIWGMDSAVHPKADPDGWLQVRYPISPDVQDHGLAGYCNQLAGADVGLSMSVAHPIERCMYSLTQGSGVLIPRPVAFRLVAASYGGDHGANRWQVRDLALTAHHLDLAGPDQVSVRFTDGQSKMVPIEIMNAGPVDDFVAVTATPAFQVSGLDVSVAPDIHGPAAPTSVLPIPAGASRTAWVRISFGYGAGDFSAGDDHEIDIDVHAVSAISPSVKVQSSIMAILRPLDRADLVIGSMVANGNDAGTVVGAQGVPLEVTLLLRNEGTKSVDEPLLVRLLAKELDADNTTIVLRTTTVASTVVAQTMRSNCLQAKCAVPVNLRWTPTEKGVFELAAEVNLPRVQDVVSQVPESEYSNNVANRRVNVGAVPLADLRILDVRLVPFEGGCAPVGEAVSRLIAGHSYCIAAHVLNAGQRAAVNPVAEFSIGASAPFSQGQGGGLPNPLNGSAAAWVFSSPVPASLPSVGNAMEFQVQLDTSSATASVEAKGRILALPVDAYRLELLTPVVPAFGLAKGSESSVAIRVLNTGTAVANVILLQPEASDLRIHLTQPPPLQAGEETEITLILQAGLSAAEGRREVGLAFSTAEDGLVNVPLILSPTITGTAAAPVSALPLRAAPGNLTSLDLVIDNAAWARNGTWLPIDSSGPLQLGPNDPVQVQGHDVVVRRIPVRIQDHTSPGEHSGVLRLRATHGMVSNHVEVPYKVEVLPAPGISAIIPVPEVSALHGAEAHLLLRLLNTGNVPVAVTVENRIDSGTVTGNAESLLLEPGANRSVALTVHSAHADRSLGQTIVHWQPPTESGWRSTEPVLWTVQHIMGQVRISSTDLEEIRIRPDETQSVHLFMQNPGTTALQAEGILVVDGVLHSRQRTEVAPGAIEGLDLPLRVSAGHHTVQLLVRPAGTTVGLTDPVFHSVGDFQTRDVMVSKQDGGLLSVPAPGMLLGLWLVVAALLHRRAAR